jgi:hypothetical protein
LHAALTTAIAEPRAPRPKEPIMRNPIAIENIEDLRRRQGIDDVELRAEIRGLQIGDFVKLTFLPDTKSLTGETLRVRITSIRGSAFRGKLADRAASGALAKLRVGAPVTFTTDHIHSVPKSQPAPERRR